jgi:elongation factor Ts
MRYIETYLHQNRIGVLVEFDTPYEITLASAEFQELAKDIAMHIAAADPTGIDANSMLNVIPVKFREGQTGTAAEALLEQNWIKDPRIRIGDLIDEVSAELKTPIRVTRFARYSIDDL